MGNEFVLCFGSRDRVARLFFNFFTYYCTEVRDEENVQTVLHRRGFLHHKNLEVITTLNVVHLFHISIIFKHNS